MKITEVEAILLSIPKIQGLWHWGWKDTGERTGNRDIVLVKIQCNDGTIGIGDCEDTTHCAPAGAVVTIINSYIGPRIVGEDPVQSFPKIREQIESVGRHYAGVVPPPRTTLLPYGKNAVVSALYDIRGKALNVPVHQLLGGAYTKELPCMPRAYEAHGTDRKGGLGGKTHTHEDIRNKIEADRAGGFKGWGYAIKVGRSSYDFDIETVRMTREIIGNKQEPIYADANGLWDTKTAINMIHQMDKYGPIAIEDPIPGYDLDGWVTIRNNVEAKLMVDEGLFSFFDVKLYIEKKAADIFILYPDHVGGIDNMKFLAEWAELYGIGAANACCSTGVGMAATMHAAAATRNLLKNPMMQINGPMELADDIIKGGPFQYHNGCLRVTDDPGLGVELDEKKVEKYRASKE